MTEQTESDPDSLAAKMNEIMALSMGEYGALEDEVNSEIEQDSPIARLANTIIQQAIKERATHIHIEPSRTSMLVRYRIDGDLYEAMPMPKYIQAPLTARYNRM